MHKKIETEKMEQQSATQDHNNGTTESHPPPPPSPFRLAEHVESILRQHMPTVLAPNISDIMPEFERVILLEIDNVIRSYTPNSEHERNIVRILPQRLPTIIVSVLQVIVPEIGRLIQAEIEKTIRPYASDSNLGQSVPLSSDPPAPTPPGSTSDRNAEGMSSPSRSSHQSLEM